MHEDQNNKGVEWGIRLLVALTLISIGVFRHLFGLNEIVGALLESGLAGSSIVALIEVHLITLLELILLTWTLGGKISKTYLVGILILFLVYTSSFFLSLSNESFVANDLSRINGLMDYPLVVISFALVTAYVLKRKGFPKRLPSWGIMTISLVLVGGYVGYYSGSLDEYKNNGEEYNVKYAKWDKYWETVEEQEPEFMNHSDYVICFFSTTCSHCNEAAKRIGVYQKKYPEKLMLAVFFAKSADGEFWNSDEKVDEFLVRNNLDIPFLKMVDYEAISIADNHFPVMVTMEDKKPTTIFIGDEVNAWAFDHLFIP